MLATIPIRHASCDNMPRSAAHNVIRIGESKHSQTRCSNCTLKHVCWPAGLNKDEMDRLDALVHYRRPVKRGHAIYHMGDPFDSIYAIRTGSFKTSVLHDDGREQVTGFHMTGDVLGFDGISTDKHSGNAIALEDSELCVIPYQQFEQLSREIGALQRHIHRLMSGEIIREYGMMMILGRMRAEERLATFLLNLSQRLRARGYSAAEFHLRMTREEIGSFLGLKLETVSRTFSKFHEQGLLSTQQKKTCLHDIEGLKRIFTH
jgi:CRP/FNR family transcriptional regulator